LALVSAFESIRIRYNLPGLVGMIVSETGASYVAVGVRKEGEAARIQHTDLFHLGSCTKAMTATVLAIFIERKLLTWETTLEALFPFKIHPLYSGLTVAMLTAHRSGISGDCINFNGGGLWKSLRGFDLLPMEGRKKIAYEVLTSPPAAKPGSKFEYANFNYVIVGAILELLTAHPWETIIQNELFGPLGMTHCGFGSQSNVPDQPWGHRVQIQNGVRLPKNKLVSPGPLADNPLTGTPAGCTHCSLEDWAKFVRFHMDGFNGKQTPLLPAPSFKKLHEQWPNQDYTCGGWSRVKRPWAGVGGGPMLNHSGSNTKNKAVVWAAPQINTALFVVSNIGGDDIIGTACNEAAAVMIRTFLGSK